MSFRCEQCHTAFPARTKPNIVVVEWYQEPRDIKREMRLCNDCAEKIPKPPVTSMEALTLPILDKS